MAYQAKVQDGLKQCGKLLGFKFSSVGWPAGTAAHVRDLWAHADLGTFTDAYPQTGAVTVAPHETQVFRVTKV
jgi:hypothetical protein